MGQHAGMVGEHKQEGWVNMVRNLQQQPLLTGVTGGMSQIGETQIIIPKWTIHTPEITENQFSKTFGINFRGKINAVNEVNFALCKYLLNS